MSKPIASLSLDLDNKWSYLKVHGDSSWETFPSYFDTYVPRYLRLCDEFRFKTTVFVVGQDAALEKNHAAIASIAEAGHEIGNHSFHHNPWLQQLESQQVEGELEEAESHIVRVTGYQPVGFRGPGFCRSNAILQTLVRRNYLYDASLFPTFLGPIARAYYFYKSTLNRTERKERDGLFGSWRNGFQSLMPKWREVGSSGLVEIPVTTMPIVRVPIHFSYLLYLASYSKTLASIYWRQSLMLCRVLGVQPSILLHPLELLGADDDQDLAFFPGMNLSSDEKLSFVRKSLALLAEQFDVITMRKHATLVAKANGKSLQEEGLISSATLPQPMTLRQSR